MGDAGFFGGGLDQYSSNKQLGRTSASGFDRLLGRKLATTPTHLTRALYLPRHANDTLHLPIYDVSDPYKAAVGETPMGSSMYTVKVSGMKKPEGNGTDGDVNYLVDFKPEDSGGVIAQVQQRKVAQLPDDTVELAIPSVPDQDFTLTFTHSGVGKATVPIEVSYPIDPSATKIGAIPHPYFTFSIDSGPIKATYQWQVHPVTDGPLRYTLVSIPDLISGEEAGNSQSPSGEGQEQAPKSEEPKPEVVGIYYHIGLSIWQGYSEGILLLPEVSPSHEGLEAVIVTSLLATVSRVRGIQPIKGKGKKEKKLEEGSSPPAAVKKKQGKRREIASLERYSERSQISIDYRLNVC